MSEHEGRSPSVVAAPPLGFVKSAPAGEHGAELGNEAVQVAGAGLGHAKRHGVRSSEGDFHVARGVPVKHFGHAVVEVGNEAVERHRHDGNHF